VQPTPPPQDSAPARDHIAWMAGYLGGEGGAALLAFTAQLSDAQAEAFNRCLIALDATYNLRALEQEAGAWRAIAGHLPGLAPVLDVLRAHLQGDQPACRVNDPPYPFNRCTIANEAGYAG
jgi:hypothetical protein